MLYNNPTVTDWREENMPYCAKLVLAGTGVEQRLSDMMIGGFDALTINEPLETSEGSPEELAFRAITMALEASGWRAAWATTGDVPSVTFKRLPRP